MNSVQVADSLVGIIKQHAQKNLWLVHNICHLYLTNSDSLYTLKDEADRVRAQLASVLQNAFDSSDLQVLLDSTLVSDPWMVWRCVRYTESAALFEPMDPEKHPYSIAWGNLRKILLDIATTVPERGIPMLLPFITDIQHKTRTRREVSESVDGSPVKHVGKFKEEEAKARFGDDYKQLLGILADAPSIPNLDPQMTIALSTARDFAREELRKKGSP